MEATVAAIEPGRLAGTAAVPPSKSAAHRAVVCAALAAGTSHIGNVEFSQDILATLGAAQQLGAKVERGEHELTITGRGNADGFATITRPVFCNESGSTLRFILPLFSLTAQKVRFTGAGRLMQRPQEIYAQLFERQGLRFEQNEQGITIFGRLCPGTFTLPGNVSSQFFTGLLFALPLLDGVSAVVSSTEIESREYITMTLEAMRQAGVPVAERPGLRSFEVLHAAYQPFTATAEADWSQAGFWYAADFLDSQVEIQGLDPDSPQGDKVVSELYWKLARPGDAEIDVSGCPDLLPPLAVMAAVRPGTTCFTNAARLRIKESDRLSTTAALLAALGGRAEEGPDFLTVHGGPLTGGTVDSANDHRIAMAAAIAATGCTGPVTIRGAECVQKSYPDFWEVYRSLGGDIHVL